MNMNIYFAITKEMIEKHSMPEVPTMPGCYRWMLSERCEEFGIRSSIAEIIELVGKDSKNFTICGAYLESAKTLSEILNSAIFGGTMDVPVIVHELIHINRA